MRRPVSSLRPASSLPARALVLGLGGGSRSLPPLSAVALTYSSAPTASGWRRWPLFRSRFGRGVLVVAGAAEFVADKFPWTQSRVSPTPQWKSIDLGIYGRTALVTVAGLALGTEHRGKASPLLGAVLAGTAAAAGNYLWLYLREAAKRATGLPDPTIGTIEDEIAVGLLALAVRPR